MSMISKKNSGLKAKSVEMSNAPYSSLYLPFCERMKGICKLTHRETELRNSHIYPKFVIDWMRETGSKYLRRYAIPNQRNQDGYKKYLLSEKAEQLFSKKEKWFAENIFRLYLNNPFSELKYDGNLFYFSILLLWRILILELEQPNINQFKFKNILEEAEQQWRLFLLNGIYPKNFNRVHLILTEKLTNHNINSRNVDNYFTRVLDGTTVFNDKINFCAIYAKFSRFIFFGLLLNGDESKLIGTKIDPIKGVIKVPQQLNEPSINGFFLNRIKQLDEMPFPTENQQEKILKEIEKDKESFLYSDVFRSLDSDMKMKNQNGR